MGLVDSSGWRHLGLAGKFMALSATVVLLTIVVFSTLDYLHERQLVASVHDLLDSPPVAGSSFAGHDHAAFLAESEHGMRDLFAMHVVHLVVTLLILLISLNLAFDRIVVRPIRRLVSATNVMARGTWDFHVPPEGQDEMAQLTIAFNRLGDVLARRVADWRNAERLSALAGLATWASQELSGIESELAAEVAPSQALTAAVSPPASEEERWRALAARLQTIRKRLDNEFYGAFQEVRLDSLTRQ